MQAVLALWQGTNHLLGKEDRQMLKKTAGLSTVASLALLLGLGFVATLPYWNAKGDDAFITFRLVRNLVEHGQLAYNLGEPVYAFTSPFWLGFLSLVYAVVGEMYAASWVASFSSLVLLVISLWLLASRLIEDNALRIFAIAIVLIDPWLMRWGFSGQEITMKIAMGAFQLVAISWLLGKEQEDLKAGALVGLLLTLGCLTRPEFLLMVLLAFGGLVLRQQYRTALVVVGVFVLTYGAWAYFCHTEFGWFLPHTIMVKTNNWRPMTFGEKIGYLFSQILPRFSAIVLLPLIGLLAGIVLVFVKFGRKQLVLREPRTLILVTLWVMGCIGAYWASLALSMSMYTLIYSPFIPLIGFALFDGINKQHPLLVKKMTWASLLIALGISAGLFAFRLGSFSWLTTSQFNRGDDERLVAFGEYLNNTLPPDARVATRELGMVGYFSNRYTIDLQGIATPQLLGSNQKEELRRLRPTHFTLYGEGPTEWEGITLEPMYTVKFRRIGGSLALDELRVMTLYKVKEPVQ